MSFRNHKIIIVSNLAVLGVAVVSFLLIRSAIAQTATTSPSGLREIATESATSTPILHAFVASTSPLLREVHIIGTKYTDYFTDGSTLTLFPGDPEIHANIAKPNAPIPTREGLTWDHSIGTYLYDTPSGDLEVGTFALQPNGSYIAYLATTTIEHATSTPFLPARIVVLREHPVTGAPASPQGEVLSATAKNAPVEKAATTTKAASAVEEAPAPTDSLPVQENSTTTNEAAGATQENPEVNTTTAAETNSASSTETQEEIGQVLGASTEENPTSESDTSATTSAPEGQ